MVFTCFDLIAGDYKAFLTPYSFSIVESRFYFVSYDYIFYLVDSNNRGLSTPMVRMNVAFRFCLTSMSSYAHFPQQYILYFCVFLFHFT